MTYHNLTSIERLNFGLISKILNFKKKIREKISTKVDYYLTIGV